MVAKVLTSLAMSFQAVNMHGHLEVAMMIISLHTVEYWGGIHVWQTRRRLASSPGSLLMLTFEGLVRDAMWG
jgi:hypothetical protein